MSLLKQRNDIDIPRGRAGYSVSSRVLAGVCLLLALAVPAARAAVIYSAPPDTSDSLGWVSNAGGQQLAQEFSLDSDQVVDTISIYGPGVNNAAHVFVFDFFADNEGAPATTSFYTITTAAATGVDTGVNWGVFDVYKYTFEVPALSLSGGTTYWFGAKSTTISWIWSHATTDGSGDLWARHGDDAAWGRNGNVGTRDNQAFELEGGVIYTCIDAFDPPFDAPLTMKAKKNGALPIKMQLFDADGYVVTDSQLSALPVVSVSFAPANGDPAFDVTDDLLPVGQANDDNLFRFDVDEDRFVYNLSSKPYKASGTYTVTAVSGDGSYQLEGCSQAFTRQ